MLPGQIAARPLTPAKQDRSARESARIEIELRGARITVSAGVDGLTLRAVVQAVHEVLSG
jgi:hypothetical protein